MCFLFGHDATVNGHVEGDVIGFAQTLTGRRESGWEYSAFTNTLTIRGTVAKNVLTFDERVNLEAAGKIGGADDFRGVLDLEGSRGAISWFLGNTVTISGKIGGGIRERAGLTITSSGDWRANLL